MGLMVELIAQMATRRGATRASADTAKGRALIAFEQASRDCYWARHAASLAFFATAGAVDHPEFEEQRDTARRLLAEPELAYIRRLVSVGAGWEPHALCTLGARLAARAWREPYLGWREEFVDCLR